MPTPRTSPRQWAPLGALLSILLLTAWVFTPVSTASFVNYNDDRDFLTGNPGIAGGLSSASLRYIVSDQAYYATGGPLTWLSHLIDIELYGWSPAGHHITSVVIHLINTGLLFVLLRRLTSAWAPSALVTALFAIHPLHVESVAWVSQRKDVVSTAFWFLSLLAYHAYVTRGRRRAYVLALLACAAGLLSKPIVATLPITMLLLDVWPLRRIDLTRPFGMQIWRLLLEKAPFALLGAVALFLVWQSQVERGAIVTSEAASLSLRLGNATVSYAAYLAKTVWPAGLAAFYPYRWQVPPAALAISLSVLVALTAAAIVTWRRQPAVFVGWFWYLGTLLPVSGVVRIGGHAMADRLTYVPLVGVFVALAWIGATAVRRWRIPHAAAAVVCIAVVGALAVRARAQVWTWQDDETLWRHAVDAIPENGRAHANLAALLTEQGRLSEAMPHHNQAARLEPNDPKVRNNFGLALAQSGDRSGAVRELREAIRLDPAYDRALVNLADQLAALGQYDEALTRYRSAISANPRAGRARMNLAVTLAQLGRIDEGLPFAIEALELEPSRTDWRFTAAMMLKAVGRRPEAIRELETVLRQNPGHDAARRELAELRRP